MTGHRTKDTHCPYCNTELTAAAIVNAEDDPKPDPGDLTMCFMCGEWLVFTEDLDLRKPNDEEFITIAFEPQCRQLRGIWLKMDAERRREKAKDGFPQPGRRDGQPPCGECHLQENETCDICGAKS
jgi:hypothetical protein